MNLEEMTPTQLADSIYQTQNYINEAAARLEAYKNQLAITLKALTGASMPIITGSFGQKYQVYKKPPLHRFSLPIQEFERLHITGRCTPAPKMTKGEMEKLLKEDLIQYETISYWEKNGWYTKEDSGELGIKQLNTSLEELNPVKSF